MEPDIDNFADILLDSYDISDQPQPTIPENEPSTTTIKQEGAKKVSKLKLDEDLLLDGKGLTLLKTETQHFKFRGKGYEDEDLKKLMTYYTVWAHNLYPKYKFQDFAQKVGKPASSKRVRTVLDTWKDEYVDRRNIRLGVRQELSGNHSADEDGEQQQVEEDESSEDDNRPLFFPITNTQPKTKSKPKKKSTATATTKATTTTTTITNDDDSDDEEEPLFKGGIKRKIATSVEEDNEEETDTVKSRESALARLAKKRQEKEANKRSEELKRKEADLERTRAELEKPEDEDMYEETNIELALSDSELELLGGL